MEINKKLNGRLDGTINGIKVRGIKINEIESEVYELYGLVSNDDDKDIKDMVGQKVILDVPKLLNDTIIIKILDKNSMVGLRNDFEDCTMWIKFIEN